MIRLYVIPGSNPSVAAELMLKRKGIDYRRRDLIPAVHIAIVRALGFPGRTVPALNSDGRKVQGSRAIARFLDELKPKSSLFPAEPARRAAVEKAERWGDEVLQSVLRRLAWFALRRDRPTLKEFLEDYRLGVPTSFAAATMAPIAWVEQRINKASAAAVRADLERLPALLDHVDELPARAALRCCARRSRHWRPRRHRWSSPARDRTTAPRCAAPAGACRRAGSSNARSTSPTAAARGGSPPGRARS